jgi:hypothetical protein
MAILSIFNGLTGLVSGYLDRKAEEKQAKHQAKMEVIKQGGNWEETMAAASKGSWKDEFWTLVFSIPLLCVFYGAMFEPDIINKVDQAFTALENLPEWYQYLLFMAVSASFGIRGADKLMQLRKK